MHENRNDAIVTKNIENGRETLKNRRKSVK
jgi:hypothetical protein